MLVARACSLSSIYFVLAKICIFKILKRNMMISSQDSPVGSALDWYSEGPGFKSRLLQLNFQLGKGCGRDSKQYAIKHYNGEIFEMTYLAVNGMLYLNQLL